MNYFTMYDADQFAFIRVPKELMTNPEYKTLSAESKLLYGVLLDRVSLSRKNNWVDDLGRIFIIYTRKEIMEIMGAADKKITRLFNELKEKRLVEEKRQGLQKPNLIYVGKFLENILANNQPPTQLDRMHYNCDLLQKRQNNDSGHVKITIPEPSKQRLNNTNINNTDISNTEILFSQSNYVSVEKESNMKDGLTEFEKIDFYFETKVFSENRELQVNDQIIDDIKMNLLDMYFAPATVVNGDSKCQELVRAALMRLEPIHIDNIIHKFKNITERIINSKAYIQAMLYNESLETNLFMVNQVAIDIADWKD